MAISMSQPARTEYHKTMRCRYRRYTERMARSGFHGEFCENPSPTAGKDSSIWKMTIRTSGKDSSVWKMTIRTSGKHSSDWKMTIRLPGKHSSGWKMTIRLSGKDSSVWKMTIRLSGRDSSVWKMTIRTSGKDSSVWKMVIRNQRCPVPAKKSRFARWTDALYRMSDEPSSLELEKHAITAKDDEHLKLLSVFHYVLGGMAALIALFPIFHLAFGIFFVMAPPEAFEGNGGDAPPQFIGWMFIGMAGAIMITGFLLSAFIIAAGKNLAKRKRYRFCLIMAGIECMFMPFGTALGVFTIIVLMRESVQARFPSNQDSSHTIQ